MNEEARLKGKRKWTVTVLTLLLAFALALLEKLTGDFTTIATVSVAAFAGGNAVEHWAKNGGGKE